MKKRKNSIGIKKNHLLSFLAGIAILIAINSISNYLHMRFDLTQEKRYTLSEETKKTLQNLEDIVYIKVYLEGEFPAGFKRLRNSTKELLDEFRAYTDNIQYDFINPNESTEMGERKDTYLLLMERGLQPTDLQVKTEGGVSQQVIFPGAIINFNDKEIPVQLLENQMGEPHAEVLNNSVQNLEFAFVSAIKELTTTIKPSIGILTGHGELAGTNLGDILHSMQKSYSIEVVNIKGNINDLTERVPIDTVKMDKFRIKNKFDALIVAKPIIAFTEKEKFTIDQFVMHGGNVLWLIDPILADMDSLQRQNVTYGIPLNLNLDDLFFNYGVRLNTDLLLDKNCMPIPMVTGRMGDQPQLGMVPWYYFPLGLATDEHPVSRNLNPIKTNFVSSIDTIEVENVKKCILLTTSELSRKTYTPARIDLNIIRTDPDDLLFDSKNIPIAVLLEGEFKSLYSGRIPEDIRESSAIDFKEKSSYSKMIFVADGDIIRNSHDRKTGEILPLGYDQDTRTTFGNRDFILNALNFLTDENNLIEVRSREVKIRQLNSAKVKRERLFWQMLNIVLPIILILIYGIVRYRIRKWKYSRK